MIIRNLTMFYDTYQPLECTVPCSMYSVLFENGLIDDPFYRDNWESLTALSYKDCTFTAVFTVSEQELCRKRQELVLKKIDTVCNLYLNGKKLAYLDNIHRTYRIDCSHLLVAGENTLEFRFSSPVVYAQERQRRHYTWGQSGRDTLDGISRIRKPGCMFGWDWAPKLPDMGIYEDIELVLTNEPLITDVYVRQTHKGGCVTLDISLETTDTYSKAVCEVVAPDGERIESIFSDGTASVRIDNAQLWWPNGYGAQPLYTVTVRIENDGRVTDTHTQSLGLRTCTVSREKDRWGSEFCFKVNGIKIFAMGGNYIPPDSLASRVTRKKLEDIVLACVSANFNCIRIWGGGFYPSDDLLELCDKYGLLIWQDFMFACSMVYLTDETRENITHEFIDNIKRMRNHACIGLLCGNNEVEEALTNYDSVRTDMLLKADYLELFEHLLPELCEKYAPDIYYWPSSPCSGGGFNDFASENHGDCHHWAVWHGNEQFESYRDHYFRFCSEFGFEAFPNLKTINTFAIEEDMNPFSYIMDSHQRCASGNGKIMTYISATYKYPYTFEQFIYASQALQANAIRYGVEHMRRNRGRCMGAIYWQLNDTWPTASWASLDYFGRWKALHYAARRFYAPVLLSAHEDGTDVALNISNEKLCDFTGEVNWAVIENDFTVIESGSISVNVGAMSAKDVAVLDLSHSIKGHERTRVLVYSLCSSGEQLSCGSLLFTKPKFFCFRREKPVFTVTGEKGTFRISVSCGSYANGVFIDSKSVDMQLSDNLFDIISGEPVTVTAVCDNTVLTAQDIAADLTIMSAADIG